MGKLKVDGEGRGISNEHHMRKLKVAAYGMAIALKKMPNMKEIDGKEIQIWRHWQIGGIVRMV